MTARILRRGYDPDDALRFTGPALEQLRAARLDGQWLLDRGYKLSSIIELISNHYQLTARQRLALQRASASRQQVQGRQTSLLPFSVAKDGPILIDGFNLIISLEIALSGSLLILGHDGVLRDLAGLRGTYHLIDQTSQALQLLGQALHDLAVPEARFYLDAAVSNSGRLRQLILATAVDWTLPVTVELVPNADRSLYQQERIVTGDSYVLDNCRSWFNLSHHIITRYIPSAWIVDFD